MGPPKTQEERKKLIEEFRVKQMRYIKESYWTTDDYISKWLEDKNYKVDNAEKAFRKMLKWRIENNIDNVLKEDYSDLYKENVIYYTDGVDKKGRPVACLPCNQCNIKEKIDENSGADKARVERVFYQLLERLVLEMRKNSEESGGEISTFLIIVDVQDVDVKFVTTQMIALVIQVSKLLEANYPGMLECCYVINASKAIKNLYTMIKGSLRTQTTDRIKMFSNKRFKWEPAIRDRIAEDQLRQRFGGTLEDGLENRKPIMT